MHRKTAYLLLVIFLICGIVARPASGQQSTGSIYIERVDLTGYPQVTVRMSTWDLTGLPVTGLRTEDVLIQEGQNLAFHPTNVEVDYDAPLSIILVLDISGSMNGQPLADAKIAAPRFLENLTRSDQAAIIAFSDTIDPDPLNLDAAREIGFSNNLVPVYDLIEDLQAKGGTHLYIALSKAIQMTSDLPAGHRAVLLLSDGKNEPAEVGDPDEPIELAKAANLPVFVIGLGSQVDEPYLRRLAGETGGLYRNAPRSSELAMLFDDMATLLKTQYTLTYTAAIPADGSAYDVTIALDTASLKVQQQVVAGPLPVIASPTATAEPTDTATPTEEPTATAVPSPTNTQVMPTATQPPDQPTPSLLWGGIIGGAILLVGGLIVLVRRKKTATPDACAACGADVTGIAGACPKCGDTRRLPKLNDRK